MRNAEAFDAFYTGSVVRVTAQLYPMTGSREAAEACAQEAYARAWQRWGAVSRRPDLEALIRTVAFRVSVYGPRRALRGAGARRWPGRADNGPAGERGSGLGGDADGSTGGDADRPAVIGALRRIPAPDCQAVVLHYLVGKPLEQVARELGVPAGTVRARLARASRALAPAALDDDLGRLLGTAADDFAATVTPRPAQLIRERGDRLRRAEALRMVAAVLLLAVAGGAAFALAAH